MIKKIIPSTLIGRSIIIIFVPIIIIVLLTSFVFYQTSWSIISKRLTESVAADINVLVKLINNFFFLFLSDNFGVKKLGFIAFKKVPDRYRKLREAERKISSNFGPKRMVGFRVMTKKPKKLTTKKVTTISM